MTKNEPFESSIAVVGAGPAGFYLADALLKSGGDGLRVDLFEKLPAPYGLVRYGVAPDHEKIKSVTRAFDRTASDPRVRLFANVRIGVDVSVAELLSAYRQVALCTGCDRSRDLGIPGESAAGSHAAANFVAWYNGHPEFLDYEVRLRSEVAVVVGVGDVSMDVTRMLVQPFDRLERTDCSRKALDEFCESRVRHVHLIARRGPAQARFADKELRAIADLDGVKLRLEGDRSTLSRETEGSSGATRRKLELLGELAAREVPGATRYVHLHFLRSPVEIRVVDGEVGGVRLACNRLATDGTRAVAVPDGSHEELAAGLIFRSVGYRGTAIEGVPFDAAGGLIPNREGRVLGEHGQVVDGLYVAGWIKRGASGVIGTNKADARETALAMLDDLAASPGGAGAPGGGVEQLLESREVRVIDLPAWRRLDELERSRGAAEKRPRVKFEGALEALEALDRPE